jgi:hypothetical protein
MSREEAALVDATAARNLARDPRLVADAQAQVGRALRQLAEKRGQLSKLWRPKPAPPTPEGEGEAATEGEAAAEGSGAPADGGSAADAASEEAKKNKEEELRTNEEEEEGEDLVGPAQAALREAVALGSAAERWGAVAQAAEDLVECSGVWDERAAADMLALRQACPPAPLPPPEAVACRSSICAVPDIALCYLRCAGYSSVLLHRARLSPGPDGCARHLPQACRARVELEKVLLAALPLDSPERVALRKRAALDAPGAAGTPAAAAQRAAAERFLARTSPAWRRLAPRVPLADVQASLGACGAHALCLELAESPHCVVLYWAVVPPLAEGAAGDAPAPAPRVGRALLDAGALAACRERAGAVRAAQQRRHLDVGYATPGGEAGPGDLLLETVALLQGPGLLAPALAALEAALGPERLAEGAPAPAVAVVLDRALEALPVEACGVLACCAAAREFSLPLLHARAQAAPGGGRGAADKAALRFVCDPRAEDREGANGAVERPGAFSTLCAAFEADLKGAGAWEGVLGSEHIPSVGEFQRLLVSARLFLYHGVGPLLAHAPPGAIAALALEQCHAVLLFDRAENEAAHRRQSRLDTRAPPAAVALRGAWATAALLSLRGCNAVAATQWHLPPPAPPSY